MMMVVTVMAVALHLIEIKGKPLLVSTTAF